MSAWTYFYNGAESLSLRGTGLVSGGWYQCVVDSSVVGNRFLQANSSGVCTFFFSDIYDPADPINGNPGSRLHTIGVEVRHVTDNTGVNLIQMEASNVFLYGSESSEGAAYDAVWTYNDATPFVGVDFATTNDGFSYKLETEAHEGGGGGSWTGNFSTAVTGDGTVKTKSHVFPFPNDPVQGVFYVVASDPLSAFPTTTYVVATKLFVGGADGVFDGNPFTASPPPAVGVGVAIAFMDDAFTANPVFTRIDDPAGIDIVSSWSTDRGRSYEIDKTKTGTATIEIIDIDGVLDPTNSSSPIFNLGPGASIDPMRQVIISLKNPLTDTWTTRFRGFIDEIELNLDESDRVLRGTISCVDAFAILARHEVIPDNGLPTGSGGTGARVKTPVDSAGDVFYEDGPVDDRIRAALADAGWPFALSVVFSGNVNVQETVYAVRSQILQIIQDAADAEFPGVANVYVDNQGRIVFHGRLARFDPAGVAAGAGVTAWPFHAWKAGDELAWSVDHTYAPIKTITFNRGMVSLINAVLATPQNILDADIEGQLSFDSGSLLTYGVGSLSFENLLTKSGENDGLNANQETKLFSDYYKDNLASPRTRISTLVFRNVNSGHVAESAAWSFLCGVEIADTVDVLTHHPGGGGFNETFFVEGVRYDVVPLHGNDHHLVTLEVDISSQAYFNTNPFSPAPAPAMLQAPSATITAVSSPTHRHSTAHFSVRPFKR